MVLSHVQCTKKMDHGLDMYIHSPFIRYKDTNVLHTNNLISSKLINQYVFNKYRNKSILECFSSPGASEWLPYIVCSSVCKLSDFLFYLLNHQENFNQAWNKAFFGKGDSSLFKRRVMPFSKGRYM